MREPFPPGVPRAADVDVDLPPEVNVKPHVLVPILVCALVACAAVATAQTHPDTTGTHADTTLSAPPPVPATTTTAPPAAPAPTGTTPTSTATPATQAAPTTQSPPAKKWYQNERLYFGGTATFSFGSTNSIAIYPMMGYKLTPRVSFGGEVGYEHVSYSSGSTNNYGFGLFSRQMLRRGFYGYEEYKMVNYEIPGLDRRDWVPFVFLGGGMTRPIGPRTSIYAEVVFDVLQDDHSPYGDWEPIVTVGVGTGF